MADAAAAAAAAAAADEVAVPVAAADDADAARVEVVVAAAADADADSDADSDADEGAGAGGVKYYGPGGLVAREDGVVEPEAAGPAPRPRRPEVPNRIVLLPVYAAKDLLEILCALLPGRADRLRDLYKVAHMPKSISVVHFLEELATRCQDLDQEEEVLQGRDPVDFWLELEDKLQAIGIKRLEPRRFTSLAFMVDPVSGEARERKDDESPASPTSGEEEAGVVAPGGKSDGASLATDSGAHAQPNEGPAPLGPDGLPILRLEIPADDFA